MKNIFIVLLLLFTKNVISQTDYIKELAKLKTLKSSYLKKTNEYNELIKDYNDSLKIINKKISELEKFNKIDKDSNLHEIAYVNYDDTKIFSQPNFDSSVLLMLSKGDSIKVLDYYIGKPYTKLLFWVVNISGKKGYIQEKKLSGNNGVDLIYFKTEIDTRNEILKRELEDIKNREELRKKLAKKETDSLKRLDYVNNCQYERNENDEFNGHIEKFTPFYYIHGENDFSMTETLYIQLRKIGSEKYVIFKSNSDLGCTSSYKNNQSYVKIKLENNDIVTFYHRSDVDCGDYRLFGRITQSDINKLKKSEIKNIRLVGTKYKKDILVTDFKNIFMKKLDCIN